jgi:cell division protein FtsA
VRGGEALGKNNIVASLDLGSSKICCMIGKITDSGDIDILGYGITASSGIKKGIVINVDLAVQSISKAVGQAEEMSGIKLSQVVIGLSGESIKLFDNRGVVAIPRSNGEITHQDVERALQPQKLWRYPMIERLLI